MPSITPSLWFDHNLEEAATFYASVFPNAHIESFNRSTDAGPGEPGSILSASFVLDGNRFIGINAGPRRGMGRFPSSLLAPMTHVRRMCETCLAQDFRLRGEGGR